MVFVRASITNIRWLQELGAGIRLILIAEGVALAAGPAAAGKSCVFAVFADPGFFAVAPMNTVVVSMP